MKAFNGIDTWVFDLDNTIYNANAHVFVVMRRLMMEFVQAKLDLSPEQAEEARDHLWRKHGTTLRGLMDEHGVEPRAFLEHTHAIDVSPVPKDEVLVENLARLPGRKFIFSNTARSFGTRMMDHLGLAPHFDGVFTIEDADFRPKPDVHAFTAFFKKYDVDPKTSCMFEDSLPNLETAHALGMATVWITGHQSHHHDTAAILPYVDARAETLNQWLIERGKPSVVSS